MVKQDSMVFQVKNFVEEYYKALMIAGGCLVLASLGGYYFWHNHNIREEHAQLAFAQTLEEVRHGEKNSDVWPNALLAAKTGLRSFKESSLGPYFLALESQVEARQGNLQQSLEVLEQALQQMGKNSPVYTIFKLRAALIKLDHDDVAIQNTGFKELEELAYDTTNKQRDEALYYLGDYYMKKDDHERGYKAWQELMNNYQATENSAASPWALLVAEKHR